MDVLSWRREGAERAARPHGALRVVQPDLTGPDPRASSYWEFEVEVLTALSRRMRGCDAGNELEFQLFVRRAMLPESTGLGQRDVAAALFVTPMTLQRWGRGEHLPFPLPRRAYLDTLADLVDRRIDTIRGVGVSAILDTPRRGARKSAEAVADTASRRASAN